LRIWRARPWFDRSDGQRHRKGHPEDECEPRCSGCRESSVSPVMRRPARKTRVGPFRVMEVQAHRRRTAGLIMRP
jgi:hypothetical protein